MSPQTKAPVWRVSVLTLFPAMFPGPLGLSLAGKALEEGLWALETVDIRDFASDKHRSVDDAPFGGGPGMVLRPDIVDRAIRATHRGPEPAVYLTPRGRRLEQAMIEDYAARASLTLLCGRFEGVDERVLEANEVEEVSLGDFVLSGGEPAAIALIDAVVRLLPGVVGAEEALAEESFERGLLEYPHYTRPADWQGRRVPEVLISGHHEKVKAWRQHQAEAATKTRRPDLWQRYLAAGNGIEEGSKIMSTIIQTLNQEQIAKTGSKVPDFAPGDTLKVNVKVIEGTRERVQAFEGVCIARKNAGVNSNFTVRKISYGEGVERVFPLYSPRIASIELLRRGNVRRAKLYYLRGLRGKAARIAEKIGLVGDNEAAATEQD